jgi:hypothetical protein
VVDASEQVTAYVYLSDSLDFDEVDLGRAREFPGYAFATAIGGHLLVSEGESPVINRFDIGADLSFGEGESLSFGNYGLAGGHAGLERHWLLDERTAYLTLEVTGRVIWDPTAFEITGERTDTQLEPKRDGLFLDATFNRPPQMLRGPVLKPFYYRDEDWFEFGAHSPIAVYDPETHDETRLIDAPCPGLEVASQDEAGNTYFSPWTYSPTLSLFDLGPKPCVLRITPELEVDDWGGELWDWTDGRPVYVFRYMRDGKALGTVLHTEEVEGDYDSGYDEELAIELDSHWRLWQFDLNAETAAPVGGMGYSAGGFSWAQFGDRTFVFVPSEDWGSSTVYEIDADGEAHARFTTPGLVNTWVRVR